MNLSFNQSKHAACHHKFLPFFAMICLSLVSFSSYATDPTEQSLRDMIFDELFEQACELAAMRNAALSVQQKLDIIRAKDPLVARALDGDTAALKELKPEQIKFLVKFKKLYVEGLTIVSDLSTTVGNELPVTSVESEVQKPIAAKSQPKVIIATQPMVEAATLTQEKTAVLKSDVAYLSVVQTSKESRYAKISVDGPEPSVEVQLGWVEVDQNNERVKGSPIWLDKGLDYITHPNAIKYCRQRGARLPTKEELQKIGSFSPKNLNGNDAYRSEFLNMNELLERGKNDGNPRYYWSSTTTQRKTVFVLGGTSGEVNDINITNNGGSVRCVRD
jgi:hypothetical protein